MIPFIHAFGRIGCFCAGCCYGRPYEGIGAVVFPEHSFALSGVKLFPIQLVEAVCLLIIAMVIFIFQIVKALNYSLDVYLFLYGIVRFVLEYFRYDDARGKLFFLSTSQCISIVMILIAVLHFKIRHNKELKSVDRR